MSPAPKFKPDLPTQEEVELAAESSRRIAAVIGHGETAQLCLYEGDERITVPVSAMRLFADLLNEMGQGNAVYLVPIGHTLTTQEAADMLNVSRPYLVKKLEAGEIPFSRVGRHRRIRYEDLRAYMDRIDEESRAAMAALTGEAQELGMGY